MPHAVALWLAAARKICRHDAATRSATASPHQSFGAFVTWMPRRVAASTSTMSTPMP
ncbi:hypothetical protein ACKI1Q_10855 [Streptomyces galilaeus]|uniref:hypothetical protein n=1 Tax=Streptomyces galilaeus TaxID=33899 RepID=UPI0038F68A03